MTDFIADLEAELVDAARRRARRGRVPRPRLVPVVAVIVIALVAVAALAAVRAFDRSRAADDRPVPPSDGVVVTLPAPVDSGLDNSCGRDAPNGYAPGRDDLPVAVFARPSVPADRLPWGPGSLPADYVDETSLRSTGGPSVMRVAGVGDTCAEREALDRGVCVIVGSEFTAARCFTDADVVAGRAVVGVPGSVSGIVPDGIGSVRLTSDGRSVTAPVVDNGYMAELPGITAGDEVRVELIRQTGCEPSKAAYDAVPGLRRGQAGTPPAAVESAMARARGAWRSYARRVTTVTGLEVWLVPQLPCDVPGLVGERVCAMPEGGGMLCDWPAVIAEDGLVVRYRRGNLQSAVGVMPTWAKSVRVEMAHLIMPIEPVARVFSGSLRTLPGERLRVRFR
jgi:hypothetical protein